MLAKTKPTKTGGKKTGKKKNHHHKTKNIGAAANVCAHVDIFQTVENVP